APESIPLAAPGVANLVVNGQTGADTYSVTGPLPYSTTSLFASGTADRSTLDVQPNATPLTVSTGSGQFGTVTATINGGGFTNLFVLGIGIIDVFGNGGGTTITGQGNTPEDFEVQPVANGYQTIVMNQQPAFPLSPIID